MWVLVCVCKKCLCAWVFVCIYVWMCLLEQFFYCENIFAWKNFSFQNVLIENFLYVFMYEWVYLNVCMCVLLCLCTCLRVHRSRLNVCICELVCNYVYSGYVFMYIGFVRLYKCVDFFCVCMYTYLCVIVSMCLCVFICTWGFCMY